MTRAEVRIGFDPEDRELISRMLDARDRDAETQDEAHAEVVAAQRRRADDWRDRALRAEAQVTQARMVVRQGAALLATARSLAAEALASETATVNDLREALKSITEL